MADSKLELGSDSIEVTESDYTKRRRHDPASADRERGEHVQARTAVPVPVDTGMQSEDDDDDRRETGSEQADENPNNNNNNNNNNDPDDLELDVECPSVGCRAEGLQRTDVGAHFHQCHGTPPLDKRPDLCHRCALSPRRVLRLGDGHSSRCPHQLCHSCVAETVAAFLTEVGGGTGALGTFLPTTCALCDSEEPANPRLAPGLAASFMVAVWPVPPRIQTDPPLLGLAGTYADVGLNLKLALAPLTTDMFEQYAERVYAALLPATTDDDRILHLQNSLSVLNDIMRRFILAQEAQYTYHGTDEVSVGANSSQHSIDPASELGAAVRAVTTDLQRTHDLLLSVEGDVQQALEAAVLVPNSSHVIYRPVPRVGVAVIASGTAGVAPTENLSRIMRSDLTQEYVECVALCHVLSKFGKTALLQPNGLLSVAESWTNGSRMQPPPLLTKGLLNATVDVMITLQTYDDVYGNSSLLAYMGESASSRKPRARQRTLSDSGSDSEGDGGKEVRYDDADISDTTTKMRIWKALQVLQDWSRPDWTSAYADLFERPRPDIAIDDFWQVRNETLRTLGPLRVRKETHGEDHTMPPLEGELIAQAERESSTTSASTVEAGGRNQDTGNVDYAQNSTPTYPASQDMLEDAQPDVNEDSDSEPESWKWPL